MLIGLFSCVQTSSNKQISADTSISHNMNSGKEIWTFYSKADSVYHVKRLVYSNGEYIFLTYDINTSQPEANHQTFISRQQISESELQKIKSESSNVNWMPYSAIPILFVQIQPSAFKDEMVALDKRQQVEELIDRELQSKNLGKWIAGDLGPGGANMLFKVQEIDKAKAVIEAVLSEHKLKEVTIVGRRINVAADDWFYEVIYPLDYDGDFLTM